MKRIAASVLVVGVAVLSAACGTGRVDSPAEGQPPEPGSAPELVVQLPVEDVERIRKIRASFERWAGSVEDRQAAAVVQAYGNNGAQADCVAEKGMTWAWQGAITGVRVEAFYMQNVFVAPPERFITFDAQINAPAARLEPLLHRTPAEPLASALDECSFTAGGPGQVLGRLSEEQLGNLTYPSIIEDLSFEWEAMLVEATAEFGSPKAVSTCLTQTKITTGPLSGVPAGKAGQGWLTAARKALPTAELIPDLGAPSASMKWDAALATEKQLAILLWECHDDSFGKALGNVEAALPRFETNLAADITAAEEGWNEVREVAGKLGWTPDDPLAGFTE